jgi:UDP-N-acetylmuramate--alanine ligase
MLRVHFIGIGGYGMHALAQLSLAHGYGVSGSDIKRHAALTLLEHMGVCLDIGHETDSLLKQADVVVWSTAIEDHHPEYQLAIACGKIILHRSAWLQHLFQGCLYRIAVIGTHGKTTTAAMLASILQQHDACSNWAIGGWIGATKTGAFWGGGPYAVFESDESDGSFTHTKPTHVICTNLSPEHLEYYNDQWSVLQYAVKSYVQNVTGNVVCAEHPVCASWESYHTVTFGEKNGDITYQQHVTSGWMQHIMVNCQDHPLPITLSVPGIHNVHNALAAIAMASQLDISLESIQQGLKTFQGVDRRLTRRGSITLPGAHDITVIDDYGHHPIEIKATYLTLCNIYPDRRILWVFQPHRYTRLANLWHEFKEALSSIDYLILMDVYSAGEMAAADITSYHLWQAIMPKQGALMTNVASVYKYLLQHARSYDVIVTQGAGNVTDVSHDLCKNYAVHQAS